MDARQQAPEVRLESLNLMPTGRSALRPYCGQWSASADRRVGAGRRAARSAQRGRFQSGGIRRLTQRNLKCHPMMNNPSSFSFCFEYHTLIVGLPAVEIVIYLQA